MEQNTEENPQEYIIKDKHKVSQTILKIEKELSAAIQKNR